MTSPRHAHLLSLLADYEPTTDLEREHVGAVTNVLSHPNAFERSHFDPGHVTASAFVVHPERDALVLVEHGKLEMWLQPGGHVERDDIDILAAARREVGEETGLEQILTLGVIDVDVHVFPRRDGQPRHLHLDVRHGFLAETSTLHVSDESTGVRWFEFEQVSSMHESLARPARRLTTMAAAGTLRHH